MSFLFVVLAVVSFYPMALAIADCFLNFLSKCNPKKLYLVMSIFVFTKVNFASGG